MLEKNKAIIFNNFLLLYEQNIKKIIPINGIKIKFNNIFFKLKLIFGFTHYIGLEPMTFSLEGYCSIQLS